ncbi:MAG: peptide deformylase [Planctomycetota bacterium]
MKYDLENLKIIHYPDPRLRQRCESVTEFDQDLATLAEHMIQFMETDRGVGLAAAQVGISVRMFVMSMTGEKKDAEVFVNPVIHDRSGSAELEEGCLSLPNINVNIRRAKHCRIEARNLRGEKFERQADDLECRVWQHEIDHLDGVLLIDRMGPSDRIATRKTLKILEDSFAQHTNSTCG